MFDLVVDEESTEVEKLKIERLEVFLNVFAGFVNLGKSEKQRKLWPIFLKRKEKNIYIFYTSLPHYFLKIC